MPSAAETQEKLYQYKRANYFKGTIAVAAIYGTVALIMLVIALVSPVGKSVLTDQLLSFTVTFIAGMILVTILLIVSIYTSKSPVFVEAQFDNMKCPDFWSLQKTPKDILDQYPEDKRFRMKYMCVRDGIKDIVSEGYDPKYFASNVAIAPNEQDKKNLFKVGQNMYSMFNASYQEPTNDVNGKGTMYCGAVFPDMFNAEDVKNDSSQQNKLRCAYSSVCQTPWTAVCPNSA